MHRAHMRSNSRSFAMFELQIRNLKGQHCASLERCMSRVDLGIRNVAMALPCYPCYLSLIPILKLYYSYIIGILYVYDAILWTIIQNLVPESLEISSLIRLFRLIGPPM